MLQLCTPLMGLQPYIVEGSVHFGCRAYLVLKRNSCYLSAFCDFIKNLLAINSQMYLVVKQNVASASVVLYRGVEHTKI